MLLDRHGRRLTRERYSQQRLARDAGAVIRREAYRTLELDARSPRLLNVNGHPTLGNPVQMGLESMWQPFPTTAADLLAAMGSPNGWTTAQVLAIYTCDQAAGSLVDALGLGPDLAEVVGGGYVSPLRDRECIGLPISSFSAKRGAEFNPGAFTAFRAANNTLGNVAAGGYLNVLMVLRPVRTVGAGNLRVLSKEAGALWTCYFQPGSTPAFGVVAGTGYATSANILGPDLGEWFNAVVVFDASQRKHRIYASTQDSALSAQWPDLGLVNGGFLELGAVATTGAAPFQIAYLAFLGGKPFTSAIRAAFWRACQLRTPFTYTRASPLIVPISASRVACYGNNQVAVGYSSACATNGNPGQTGLVAEDGVTFEGVNSTDVPTNTLLQGAGMAKATIDGPDGCRSAVRITQGAAGWTLGGSTAYLPQAAPIPIVGASNVPWYASIMYKRATVGQTARMGLVFTGDPGGNETFVLVADNNTPADWVRAGGTCTPTRAAHTGVYVEFGQNAAGETADYAEPFIVKNRSTAPLGWRRVGTVSAATSTTNNQVANTGNRRYFPPYGSLQLTIAGFQGTAGAVFLSCGAAGAAGAMVLDYSGGQLRLRVWDSAAALVITMNCGAVDALEHTYDILWDARNPLPGIVGSHLAVCEGSNVLASSLVSWTPPTADVTPIAIGCDTAGANAARCLVL